MSLPLSGEMPIFEDNDQICVLTPVGVIPIGHGVQEPPSPRINARRKPPTEFAHHERW